ncbi:MAG: DUF1016 N-terminal domain-containing protein [Candidatus Omnitrophica bacterium]|nr:DUF1016 N-terminal domain-containing protein [Candidatus Omnitrophota bacterium]
MKKISSAEHSVYDRMRTIIENARGNVVRVVNAEMVTAYWRIGKEIVEEEQRGEARASYGKSVLSNLAVKLTAEFGKGFDESNLRNIRHLYLIFPIRDALRHELSWTHCRILMRIDNPMARSFYEIECEDNDGRTEGLYS